MSERRPEPPNLPEPPGLPQTLDPEESLDQAAAADRYDLYQRAVQAPEADVEFLSRTFEAERGRVPLGLREDFAGTALLSAAWAGSRPDRWAIAVDFDNEPLAWGARHNLTDPDVAERVELYRADVRAPIGRHVDLVCAPNFSICCLHTRAELVEYLDGARSSLVADGFLVCELYGGTEAIVASTEERECDGFDYTWEQESFNPIDHRVRCHIHFDFPDGSGLERAFTYDFRLWTIPELTDAMREVGFAEVRVYWESVDDEGDGTGEYLLTSCEENQEGWLVYLVALA